MNYNGNGNGETRWYGILWRSRLLVRVWVSVAAAFAVMVPLLVWYGDRNENWDHQRLEHHESLLSVIDGITCQQGSAKRMQAKSELSRQLNLCWLYCSDTVIEIGYELLERVQQDMVYTRAQQRQALLEFKNTIRLEMFPERTYLPEGDAPDNSGLCVNE